MMLRFALAVPGLTLPHYSITTNAIARTGDDSMVLPQCLLDYNEQMDTQAKNMGDTVDLLIGNEICSDQSPGDVFITSVITTMQFSGSQVRLVLGSATL